MTDEIAESQGEVSPEETGEDVKIEESSASETEDTSAESPEDKPKKSQGVQKRIDELTANWRETQRQNEQLMEQNRQLQEAFLKSQEKPQETAPQATEPKLDDYQSYDEYLSALADHRAEQKVRSILEEQEAQRAEVEAAKTRDDRKREFMARADTFKAERPDFDTVAFNPLLPVTQEMADVIDASENGPQVLYHLGQNMSEAQRIANLPPVMQAAELGRIEARITMPQANLNSAAPDPIEPVGGGDGPGVAKHPSEAKSMDEYVRLRNS